MKHLLLFLFTMINFNAFAQSDIDRSIDKENGAVVFKGQFTFDDLKNEKSFDWFISGENKYKPDSTTINFLKKSLNHYELIIVLGTWCSDSKDLIPKLYKTLLNSNFPLSNLKMYGVNREKETKYMEAKLYNIELVPTIILMRNNMEIGRIVETVNKSVEQDLKALIEKDLNESKY